MLTIDEIYTGLKMNIAELEPKIEDLRKKINDYHGKLKEAEDELNNLTNQYESLRMSRESLELIDVSKKTAIEKNPSDGTAQNTKTAKPVKPVKKLTWTTKNAKLLKIDRFDNVLGRYPSQVAAARDMHWDQSSLSRFMKFSREQQIAKKNFYFKWEY